MRVADVDREAGEPPSAHDRRARAELVGLAHLDGDVGGGVVKAVQYHRPRAGQRADDELVARLQSAGPQVVGEHPNTVAAHLRDRAVGVAVVHVPVVRRRRLRAAGRTPRVRRPHRPWSPAARRRPRSPGDGRTARPPRRGPASACRRGRAAARNRSACRGPWRTSPDQDTCRHIRSVSSTFSLPAPSSQTMR